MQLVEQAPLWGRFGYSDLKGAVFRVGLCIFYLTEVMRMACVGGATGQFGRLQPWSVQSWSVLRQPGRAAELVL